MKMRNVDHIAVAGASAVLAVVMITAGGCTDPEEECNAARVAAHDAWTSLVSEAEEATRDSESRLRAAQEPSEAAWEQECTAVLQEFKEQVREHGGGWDGLAIYGAERVLNTARQSGCDAALGLPLQVTDEQARAEGVPSAAIRARDAALGTARQARVQAQAEQEPLREKAALDAEVLRTGRAALAAARGPAIEARDAYQGVPAQAGNAALEAAISASEASWEACQSVDP